MKKIIIFSIIGILFVAVLIWFGKMNSKSTVQFETEQPFKTTIIKKTVATGKVTPLEEVEIKPQIAGIVDKIVVEEGQIVKIGDLLATVKVVPNEQSLQSAKGRINSVQIQLSNAKTQYERNKVLFERGVISSQQFEASQLAYDQATNDLENAKNDYQIIKRGSVGSSEANTNIRATASGMVVEIPVKKGYQVIQANSFNAGTTIATIADMNKMIFEGKVDEAEVGKIQKNIDLDITLGALNDKKFPAKLNFIAPKGTEQNGAVQFTIKADVTLDDNYFLRAGYSANAEIVLEKKEDVFSIKESLLQFDKKTDEPFVEVLTSENKYERKSVELGISDGINVEVISGVAQEDKIKVWNKTSKKEDNNDIN